MHDGVISVKVKDGVNVVSSLLESIPSECETMYGLSELPDEIVISSKKVAHGLSNIPGLSGLAGISGVV